MIRQEIMNKARTSSRNNQTIQCIKRKMVVRRGGNDCLSESKNKNDSRKEVGEEEGGQHVNRWHGKSSMTDRRNEEWEIIKEK